MYLVINSKPIKVVELTTPSQQAQGFMHYSVIPLDYCLRFVGAGQSLFHMETVGARLALIGINREGTVICKEIRLPESRAKALHKARECQDIIEIHPLLARYICEGDVLEFVDKKEAILDLDKLKQSACEFVASVPNGSMTLFGSEEIPVPDRHAQVRKEQLVNDIQSSTTVNSCIGLLTTYAVMKPFVESLITDPKYKKVVEDENQLQMKLGKRIAANRLSEFKAYLIDYLNKHRDSVWAMCDYAAGTQSVTPQIVDKTIQEASNKILRSRDATDAATEASEVCLEAADFFVKQFIVDEPPAKEDKSQLQLKLGKRIAGLQFENFKHWMCKKVDEYHASYVHYLTKQMWGSFFEDPVGAETYVEDQERQLKTQIQECTSVAELLHDVISKSYLPSNTARYLQEFIDEMDGGSLAPTLEDPAQLSLQLSNRVGQTSTSVLQAIKFICDSKLLPLRFDGVQQTFDGGEVAEFTATGGLAWSTIKVGDKVSVLMDELPTLQSGNAALVCVLATLQSKLPVRQRLEENKPVSYVNEHGQLLVVRPDYTDPVLQPTKYWTFTITEGRFPDVGKTFPSIEEDIKKEFPDTVPGDRIYDVMVSRPDRNEKLRESLTLDRAKERISEYLQKHNIEVPSCIAALTPWHEYTQSEFKFGAAVCLTQEILDYWWPGFKAFMQTYLRNYYQPNLGFSSEALHLSSQITDFLSKLKNIPTLNRAGYQELDAEFPSLGFDWAYLITEYNEDHNYTWNEEDLYRFFYGDGNQLKLQLKLGMRSGQLGLEGLRQFALTYYDKYHYTPPKIGAKQEIQEAQTVDDIVDILYYSCEGTAKSLLAYLGQEPSNTAVEDPAQLQLPLDKRSAAIPLELVRQEALEYFNKYHYPFMKDIVDEPFTCESFQQQLAESTTVADIISLLFRTCSGDREDCLQSLINNDPVISVDDPNQLHFKLGRRIAEKLTLESVREWAKRYVEESRQGPSLQEYLSRLNCASDFSDILYTCQIAGPYGYANLAKKLLDDFSEDSTSLEDPAQLQLDLR